MRLNYVDLLAYSQYHLQNQLYDQIGHGGLVSTHVPWAWLLGYIRFYRAAGEIFIFTEFTDASNETMLA